MGYMSGSAAELDATSHRAVDGPVAFFMGHPLDSPGAWFAAYGPDASLVSTEFTASEPWQSEVPIILGDDALTTALKPMIDDADPAVRRRALRTAGRWRVQGLADAIESRMNQDGPSTIEAAWALAALKGKQAVPAITKAYQSARTFNQRVELAALLRLIGDPTDRPVLHQAVNLLVIQRLRGRAADDAPAAIQSGGGSIISAIFGGGEPDVQDIERGGDGEPRWPLVPWFNAVALAERGPLRLRERQLAMQSRLPQSLTGKVELPPTPQQDLAGMYLGIDSELHAPAARALGLPLTPLTTFDPSSGKAPLFARLCAAEQALEPICYVQLAGKVQTLPELRAAWQAWWREHGQQSRQQWWRLALQQATADLTHEHWWIRLRRCATATAHRPRHHVAQRVRPRPVEASSAAVANMAERFRGRAAGHVHYPRGNRSRCAAGRCAQQRHRAGAPRALVRLAGWGPRALSQAALLQLNMRQPTPTLLKTMRIWQFSPRIKLGQWVRERVDTGP